MIIGTRAAVHPCAVQHLVSLPVQIGRLQPHWPGELLPHGLYLYSVPPLNVSSSAENREPIRPPTAGLRPQFDHGLAGLGHLNGKVRNLFLDMAAHAA